MKDYQKDGYKKLLIAIIKQWKADGKPKTHADSIIQYAKMLRRMQTVRSAEYYRTVALPEKVAAVIHQMEQEEPLWGGRKHV